MTSYIALGSNLGCKETHITLALRRLNAENGVCINALSKIYKTDPVGYADQDFFLNMVCRVETKLDPYKLLDVLHKIENSLDRKRTIQNGPRTIDLDILLYDDLKSNDPLLTIPHPRMFARAFVMVPLADIYPTNHIAHNDGENETEKSFDEIIAKCDDRSGIVFFKSIAPDDI